MPTTALGLTPVTNDTTTTAFLAEAHRIAVAAHQVAERITALHDSDAFRRQARPVDGLRAQRAAGQIRRAGVDLAAVLARLHTAAVDAGHCGHGYPVGGPCHGCDRDAAQLRPEPTR